MQTKKYQCRVITPMFLNGMSATPELRVPSIRGMLRFWWRALQVREGLGYEQLKKEENTIFGGTGDDPEDGRKSAVILRLEDAEGCTDGNYRVLPHSDSKKFTKQAIMPGSGNRVSRFTVVARFDENIIDEEKLDALFFVTSHLGGLGNRSRRGFGSFVVDNLVAEEGDIVKVLWERMECLNKDAFCRVKMPLKNGAGHKEMPKIKLRELFGKKEDANIFSENNSKTDYPYIRIVEIGEKPHGSMDALLKLIGNASHLYDSRATGYVDRGERLASPIYVSIIQNKKKEYLPIVTTLHNTEAEKVTAEEKGKMGNFVKMVLGKEVTNTK